MPPASKFTEDDVPRFEAFLAAGLSYRQIARELACNKDTVSVFVRKHLPEWHARRENERTAESPLRILILDIETKPGKTYFWHTNEKFIRPEYVIEDTETLCFAAKWHGDPTIHFSSVYRSGRQVMVGAAHELLNDADGVVTYNGDSFDLPHLNLEFLKADLAPPSPYKSIDLLKTIRKQFRFTNNRLTRVAKSLEIGEKVSHEGFTLWELCMAGDPHAWKKMQEYNQGDVLLTEQLYVEVLPWLQGHPSHAAYHTDARCPNCGSEDFSEAGYYRTKTSTYKQYQCLNPNCGKWFRDRKNSFTTSVTETAA